MLIPDLHLPTTDQLRAASASWLAPLRPCLYTHWPERYRQLSFRTHVRRLSPTEVHRLIDTFDGKPLGKMEDAALLWKIKRSLSEFDTGSFFRLESRSPKDNYWGEATNFRVCSWHDVNKLLYSERILDDLVRYQHAEEPCRLLFREWHLIQKPEEFRCFIRRRKLAGISQYHYAAWDEISLRNKPLVFHKVICRSEAIQAALTQFIEAEIIPHLHVEDLVADLWLDHTDKVTLIEVNPYGLSDPCLFTYEELEQAEGEFRIVRPAHADRQDSTNDSVEKEKS